MSKIIGVVGTRRKDLPKHFDKVKEVFLEYFKKGDTICSGLCPKGADRFAVILAEELKIKKLWYPAEWDKYGRCASHIRNDMIAKKSDILIALVAPDRKGGTEDTIKKFIYYHGEKNLIILK